MPKISIVAAMDQKRGIGKNNKLPWHIPEDLKRFKEITFGHPVIMGRKTYESIGRLLPNRLNIIITQNKNYALGGAVVVHSLQEAIEKASEEEKKELFIIGGGQIFAQAIPLVDRLYLTIVKGDYDVDTFFPDYSDFDRVIMRQHFNGNPYSYEFLTLERN